MSQFVDYSSLTPPPLPPAWPKGLLTFAIIIFLFVIGGTFGLGSYIKIKTKDLNAINKNIDNIRLTFSKEDEQKIALFEKKLNNLKNLLNNHIHFSKVIAFLEKNTHPQVYYTDLNFDLTNNTLKLEGVALNQQVLSEAISGFSNNPADIKTIIVRSIKTNENNTVSFNIELILQPQLLK
ncbi:MAG: hypothetical protein ACP5PR_01320 [Minisyncoccia bacterium]|jgi:hypothetical protein